MKKIIVGFFILISLVQNSWAMNSRNLTILAEPNMVLALTKIARIYSQQTNVITSLNFAPATDLVKEVEFGEPADIFVSAHTTSIETLKQKGLIDVYNIGYIAQDEIVLATSKYNSSSLRAKLKEGKSFEDSLKILDENKANLVVDSQKKSSGKLSMEVANLSSFKNLNLIKRSASDKSSVMMIVKDNPEYFAVLLRSQVIKYNDLEILAKKNDNIFYQALVIAGDNMDVAREFLRFLKSPKARSIMIAEGFVVN